jgi:N-acetylmuramoyl-L-alanine amidase
MAGQRTLEWERLTSSNLNRSSNLSGAARFAVAVFLPCVVAIAWSAAQAPPATGQVRTVIVIDPAHGGADTGARLADQVLEKDVTLAMAARMRAALTAAGFTVVATRDSDVPNGLTADQRAEIANRQQRALACVVLHATGAGSGVHLYASPLEPGNPVTLNPDVRPPFQPTPWDEAQADWVGQSLRLQDHLTTSLKGAKMPILRGRAALRPLDNLTCPAIAVELAPLGAVGEDRTSPSDPRYQQRWAEAVVSAMKSWRDDPASHPAPPASPTKPVAPAGVNE